MFEKPKPRKKFVFQFPMSKIMVSVSEKIHHFFEERKRATRNRDGTSLDF
jgi:hypothetical protein